MTRSEQRASPRELQRVLRGAGRHWVGDGFPVRTLFSYHDGGPGLSPFLLFDYAGPVEFPPTTRRLGVGEHPHRGFETVTIVYAGEVEHRDSSGGGGRIGPGDVQWMTAASGIVHDEFHGGDFARRGGTFEMVQLWVNLPARAKMSAPRYQGIVSGDIPIVDLPAGGGSARIIAGELAGVRGPAQTFTPVHLWDLFLRGGETFDLPVRDGYTTLVAVLRGGVDTGGDLVASGEVAVYDRRGDTIRVAAPGDTTALLLSAEPIDEPIVGEGPFVMNSEPEIRRAIADYQSGRMGHLD